MTTELRSLGAADLTRLGGLKTQCNASLVCTEHNLSHPCEACEALGYKSVACSACLHEFPEGLSAGGERPCASQAVFQASGRVAFEADAMAALAAEAREKESARERKKRQKEEAERERERQARKEAAERLAVERERIERREAERKKAEPTPPTPTPTPTPDPARGHVRARLAVWASVLSTGAGAYTLWQTPLLELPRTSTGIQIVYAVAVLLVWAVGLETMTGKSPAHATLRWWAPLAWAFMSFAWPGTAGLAVAYLVGVSGLGAWLYGLQIFLGLGLLVTAVACMAYGGVALTMRPPWPKGFLDNDFKPLGSGWVWLALLATLALNVATWDGSGRLLESTPGFSASTALRKPLIEQVVTKPPPDKNMRGFVRATLADIAESVNDHTRLGAPAVRGALPQVDAAVDALARLPRPPAGDRVKAKALAMKVEQLRSRDADWEDIAKALAEAHAADPRNVQTFNELVYAQLRSGLHTQALANILEYMRIAPASHFGWYWLAQVRLATANGDPSKIQEAARYYVVSYWFANDRGAWTRFMQGKLKASPGDPPDNPAAISMALQRLPKRR